MKKLKEKVRIIGRTYKVFLMDKIIIKGISYMGYVNNTKNEIYIKYSLSSADYKETLYHEILHSIFYQMSKRKYKNRNLEDTKGFLLFCEKSEILIDALTYGIINTKFLKTIK